MGPPGKRKGRQNGLCVNTTEFDKWRLWPFLNKLFPRQAQLVASAGPHRNNRKCLYVRQAPDEQDLRACDRIVLPPPKVSFV